MSYCPNIYDMVTPSRCNDLQCNDPLCHRCIVDGCPKLRHCPEFKVCDAHKGMVVNYNKALGRLNIPITEDMDYIEILVGAVFWHERVTQASDLDILNLLKGM